MNMNLVKFSLIFQIWSYLQLSLGPLGLLLLLPRQQLKLPDVQVLGMMLQLS